MLSTPFARLFDADLNKLKNEISIYKSEDAIWLTGGEIRNTAGNLCLHITGSLDYFIGAILGQSAYVRIREEEFAIKKLPRETLIGRIETTQERVKEVLMNISGEGLNRNYPVPFGNNTETVGLVLTYLVSHVAYHVGQVSYHRRLVDKG